MWVNTVICVCFRIPAAGPAKEGSSLVKALSGLPKLGRWGKNREATALQPVAEAVQVCPPPPPPPDTAA